MPTSKGCTVDPFDSFFTRVIKGAVIILLGDVWEVVIIRCIRCFYTINDLFDACLVPRSVLVAVPKVVFLGVILVILALSAGHLLERDTCFYRLQAKRCTVEGTGYYGLD
jgi:hypothetical protein